MDEQEEVQILDDPPVFVKIPHRSFSRNETIELLNSVVQTARITWEEERKLAIEEAEQKAKSRETEIRLDSYRKGRHAALLICKASIRETIADSFPVRGQPGIPRIITDVLSYVPGRDHGFEDKLWTIPAFEDVVMYLAKLEGSLKMVLGNYEGESVYVIADGWVETNAADEDGFYGKCTITLENSSLDGYCLGHLFLKGTAIILGDDERLYLYTPNASLDLDWPPMDGSIGATLEIDSGGKIALSRRPDLEVVSFADW